ncbi:hypothetical protein TWF696_006091 [Orbilia brochopaga]|uniref:Uncharacterized protein n=1 Tax=Orbilia brochopaga TaxID=3140254 RepID=A0AAV9UV82_9PEZI
MPLNLKPEDSFEAMAAGWGCGSGSGGMVNVNVNVKINVNDGRVYGGAGVIAMFLNGQGRRGVSHAYLFGL